MTARKAPPTPKLCRICFEPFTPTSNGRKAIYCGKRCRKRAEESTPLKKVFRRNLWERIKADPIMHARTKGVGAAYHRKRRLWLSLYKLEHGCIDCGYKLHPAALQMDHTGKKTRHIGKIRAHPRALAKEIVDGACVVRCANCHAVKTWAETNKLPNPDGFAVWRIL